ncbi:MAG: hypothetical protein ABSB38_00320 [Dehalococcoidia bacterium]
MERKFHLLISPKFFQKSLEYGLFGVSERNLNQLANVRSGDIAFYYTAHKIGPRTEGVIYGPFEVISGVFFNDQLVWAPAPKHRNRDKYPFRIKIKYLEEHVCLNPVPVQAFWDLREEGKIKSIIDSSALIDKAVCTLLHHEGILLMQTLLQANQIPGIDMSPYKGHAFQQKEIDIFKAKGKDIQELNMEAYLEAYLLMNPQKLHQLAGFDDFSGAKYQVDILNQVSTFIAGGAIDIVCLYKKRVLDIWLTLSAAVFELKKGVIDPYVVDQLTRYIEWTARLIPGAKHEMIKGIIIGRDFGKQTKARNAVIERITDLDKIYSLSCYIYHLCDKEITFEKLK